MKRRLRALPAWKLALLALLLLAIPLLAQATSAGLPVTKQMVLQSGFQATQGAQATVRHPDMVKQALHSDTSPILRTIPAKVTKSATAEDNENPTILRSVANKSVVDSVIQRALSPLAMPAPIQNFEGQYNQNGPLPPDTNGDVGRNQYVQIVNSTFQVFSKTGTSLYGPANINTLFTGFGGNCEVRNDGDPVALYDAFADRWILTQFTSAAPYMQCIAISTSGDPTGSYYRYAFLDNNSGTTLGDYPKLGVWPDAYYMTTNEFAPSFVGDGNYAYDRTKMLVGDPTASEVYFHGVDGGKLPSDVDGATLPPMGSPNYIMEWYNNSPGQLAEYKFHVDFTTPANSTYTGPFLISVTDFDPNAPSVPQPGTTTLLDNLSDRLMFRVAYRNYGDHEALVLNHTVNASGVDGVRWYELRDPNNALGASVFQQGTYAPGDGIYRWMGSIAQDRAGDLALGFSAGNATTFPGLRYAGRLVGDPAGQLSQGEATLFAGTGSEDFPAAHRWGDYSAMQVDPLDDCTFWYTNMYWSVTGERNWRTRIGSFKFPFCSAQNTPTPVATAATTPTNTPLPTATACAGALTFTNTINNDDPTQAGRLGLSNPVSVCGVQKATPAISDSLTRHYKSYTYTNATGSSQCLTISISQACGNNAIQSATYLGTYNPTSIQTNYLGDGGAAGPNFSYSVTLPSGQTAVIVVAEVSPNLGCSTYTLMVNPCGASPAATSSATSTTVPSNTITASPSSTITTVPSTTSTTTRTSTGTSTATANSTSTAVSTGTVTVVATGTGTSTTVPSSTTTRTSTAVSTSTGTSTTLPTSSSTSTATTVANTPSPTQTGQVLPGTQSPSVVPSTATATATTCVINYSDVHTYDPFYKYIVCLTCRGIVGGFSDGTFRPNAPVTRGQASKMISNSAGFQEAVSGQSFPDVHPGDTYYVYIQRLAQRGLIGGFPDGTFRPNQSITRGQLSKIDSNAAGFSDTPPSGTQSFTDVLPTSTYYLYIERLSRRGIISGYQCGISPAGPCDAQNRPYYLPGTDITRGQTTKIVANTFFPIDCAPGRPQLKP